MSGEATSIKVPRPAPPSAPARLRWRRGDASGPAARTRLDVGVAGVALGAIVTLSLFIVLITANRPSLLAPTTHTGFYPRWMSGPLGGLLPGLTGNSTTLRFMFTGAIVVMFIAYVWVLRCAPRVPVAGSWRRSCSSTRSS